MFSFVFFNFVHGITFGINIIKRQKMIERKNVVGYKPTFFELDKVESLDIYDFIDFKIAELMYRELGLKWLMKLN